MQRVAVGWLAWRLTESGLWLGIIAFADLAPALFIGPIAGTFADRHSRLKVILVCQSLAMIQARGKQIGDSLMYVRLLLHHRHQMESKFFLGIAAL